MYFRGAAEMLLIQLHQIRWEEQKAWIVHHTELIYGFKCYRNHPVTSKTMKDFYLWVYELKVQHPNQLQNINYSFISGVE